MRCALFAVRHLEYFHLATMEGQDAMIAELMGMGFQPEDIEEYQLAMKSSSEGFSMQAATEWSAPICYTCSYVSNTQTLRDRDGVSLRELSRVCLCIIVCSSEPCLLSYPPS